MATRTQRNHIANQVRAFRDDAVHLGLHPGVAARCTRLLSDQEVGLPVEPLDLTKSRTPADLVVRHTQALRVVGLRAAINRATGWSCSSAVSNPAWPAPFAKAFGAHSLQSHATIDAVSSERGFAEPARTAPFRVRIRHFAATRLADARVHALLCAFANSRSDVAGETAFGGLAAYFDAAVLTKRCTRAGQVGQAILRVTHSPDVTCPAAPIASANIVCGTREIRSWPT